ncbi:MAG: hypothetical protein ACHQ9S_24095 [Candidatus Binatia bacterium]
MKQAFGSARSALALLALAALGACRDGDASSGSDLPVQVDFSTKDKCADRGEKFLAHERSIDVPQNGIDAVVRNEEFTYNRSLNTCLVYFEVVEAGAGTTYNIVDTLRNKRLYHHVTYRDQSTQRWWDESCKAAEGCLNADGLERKRIELFGK